MRLMATCGCLPSAVAMRRSFSASSSVQGLKSILPTVTCRPSFSLAIFWSWLLAIGGTASHAMTHRANNTSNATTPRRTHLFCLIEAASIHRSVPQTDANKVCRNVNAFPFGEAL
ncbi:hypothetical protein FQZ97_723930 [compost metagenome]